MLLQPPSPRAMRMIPWRTTPWRTAPRRTTTSWMRLQGNIALTDWSRAVLPTINSNALTRASERTDGPGPAEGTSATGAHSEIALRRRRGVAPRSRALDSRRKIADQRRSARAGREARRPRPDHAGWPAGAPACPQGQDGAHPVVSSLAGRRARFEGGDFSRRRALEPAPGRRPLAGDSADASGGRGTGDPDRRRILGAPDIAGRACADHRLRSADARPFE